MAITSFPYVSINGDRKVTAADEANRINLIAGSGVIFDVPTSFACTKINQSMNVEVAAGSALIDGHCIISDSTALVEITTSDATYPRKDLIALESNTNTGVRGARIKVVKGTPAGQPTEPTLEIGDGFKQIKLATILIPAGATNLSSATITDARTKGEGKHTHAALTSVNITDPIAPGTAKVANIIFGTGDAPTIDSTMPQGTIYIKYVP